MLSLHVVSVVINERIGKNAENAKNGRAVDIVHKSQISSLFWAMVAFVNTCHSSFVIVLVYTVMGKTNLNDTAWVCPTNAAHRFFKVKEAMA